MATVEQELQQQHQDTKRLLLLPPLKYEMMSADERLAFIQWYQQTQEGRELFGRYPQDALKCIVDAYPKEEPVDDRLKESFAESFESYVQQKWYLDGKRPPQRASYFLFHKRFSETESTVFSLMIPTTGMVTSQVFNLQEINQIYDQGLPTIVTAVGSKELHFHELGKIQRVGLYNSWYICMEENHQHIRSAIAEFTEQKTTEVWFRRERNGTPQFIFCPARSATLRALSLPLKQPGQPRAVLELSRLEALPPLVPERFSADHKGGFYRWLLATNKFHIEDDDPESLQFAPLLFGLCSNDFHVCDPKIPDATRLYEEYASEMWRVRRQQPPFPSYVYLFKSGVQPTNLFWIWLPQELMEQASSLILNTAELDQLSSSNRVPVCISIDIGSRSSKCFAVAGMLENVGTHCGFSFSNKFYRDTFRGLKTGKHLELWFSRSEEKKPHFIIRPRNKK